MESKRNDIKGFYNARFDALTVRYKKDDIGESLFISNEDEGVMMMIPFEKIRKEIGGNV